MFAQDTLNVLAYLSEIAPDGLRKEPDLGVLFELSAQEGKAEEMNRLLFDGSALYRLYHTLRKQGSNAEGYQALETEFRGTAERVKDLVAQILLGTEDEEVLDRFETTYYGMTQGALRNMIDLAHDLNVAKGLQNDQRQSEQ